MIRNLIASWLAHRAPTAQAVAQARLAKIVEARRNSPEIVDYRKRRAAALMAVRGR